MSEKYLTKEGLAYFLSKLDTRFAAQSSLSNYLPLTGGTLSGNLVLNNTVCIKGYDSGGTARNIIQSTSGNNIYLGGSGWNYIYAYNLIVPSSNEAHSLGTTSLQWNNICGKTLYENGTSLVNKYLGIQDPANWVKMHGRITSANINTANNLGLMQVDLATSSMTEGKPESDGFIQSFFWDDASATHNNSWTAQLYIPNRSIYHLSVRSYDPDRSAWNVWRKLAYISDIPINVSQLTNDSNFATETYVDTAIATAITTALNTPV